MNLDDLKWRNANFEDEQVTKGALLNMLNVNNHPTLKKIKSQMIIESVAWIGFLAFYYDFFDGHLKPVLWNLLLIIAVGLLLIHNLLGYQVTNNPINGHNILDSLRNYLKKIRSYSYLSISTRVFALIIIFGYFLSGVESFESRHYWSIGLLPLFVLTQVYFLWRVWSKRINTISSKYGQLINEK